MYEYDCISKKEGQGKKLKELGGKKLEKKKQNNRGKYNTVTYCRLKLSRNYVGEIGKKKFKAFGDGTRRQIIFSLAFNIK